MLNTISGLLSGGAPAGGDYESIATSTVGAGGTSVITFTSIPSTYSHLQIRGLVKSGTGDNSLRMELNADTGSNYTRHLLYGDGSSAGASGGTGFSSYTLGNNGYTTTSGTFCVYVIDILDYANTNKYKTNRSFWGIDNNGAGQVSLYSGLWLNTAAINRLDIKSAGGETIQQYSSFALYGIK
jgi:hypothetical protein